MQILGYFLRTDLNSIVLVEVQLAFDCLELMGLTLEV